MKKTQYILLLLVTILIYRCTEPYTPKLDSTYTRLAVEAYLTDIESYNYVRLTFSDAYLANKPATPYNGAFVQIRIYEDTAQTAIDSVDFTEKENSGYYYAEGFTGTPGLFYELVIDNVNLKDGAGSRSFSAIDYMPLPIAEENIDSISVRYIYTDFFDYWSINLHAYEPVGKNWYVFHKEKNQTKLSDTIHLWSATNDDFIDGAYVGDLSVQSLSNQDSVEYPELGDTITLEMWNISGNFYENIIQTQEVISYQNPLFSGPPANVYTNLPEGAVGYFSAFSTNRISTVMTHIPQEALDRRDEE